jgi:lysophospholipase L1-like esterase
MITVFIYRRVSQKQPDTNKIRIDFIHSRDSLFSRLPIDSGDVVFLGNSITEGFPLQEIFKDSNIKNRGVSSSETIDLFNRLDLIIPAHPKKIFLMAGINDIKNGVNPQHSIAIYKMIVDKIRRETPRTKLYLESVLPMNDFIPDIKSYNDSICKLGNFINLYPYFQKDDRMNDSLSYDGLHLNHSGYLLWKKLVQDEIYAD